MERVSLAFPKSVECLIEGESNLLELIVDESCRRLREYTPSSIRLEARLPPCREEPNSNYASGIFGLVIITEA